MSDEHRGERVALKVEVAGPFSELGARCGAVPRPK